MMANINTRKGLALAALVGLGTTLISGAPAHAAANVALVPSEGTSFGMVAGQSLELTATASSEIPSSSWDTMKFKVVNVDGKNARVTTWDNWYDSIDGVAGYSEVYSDYNNWNNQYITIHSYDDDETSHYTVTAWLDADDDGIVDAGEYAQTQTVTFYAAADLNVTTTIESPIYTSDDEADVTVKINNINMDQSDYWGNEIYEEIWVQLNNGQGIELDWHWTSLTDGVYSATEHFSEAAGTILSAQAWWSNCSDNICDYDGDQKIGAPATTQVLAHTVDYVDWSMDATLTSQTDGDVATNEAHKVVLTAYDDIVDADDVALAGKTVKIWVYSYEDLDSDETITINGVTYSANSSLPGQGTTLPLTATTDANGQVVLSVSSAGLTDGDTVQYFAEAENNKNDTFYTYQDDRSYTGYVTNQYVEFCCVYATQDIVAGGKASVDVEVYDQFGKTLPNGWDARAILDDSDRATTDATDSTNVIVPVVGGKVSLTVTDNGAGIGYNNYYLDLRERDATTGAYDEDIDFGYLVVHVVEAADIVPGVITVENDEDGDDALTDANGDLYFDDNDYGGADWTADLSTGDFGSAAERRVLDTIPDVNGFGAWVRIKSADTPTYQGRYIAGAKVTISGAGLQFYAEDDMNNSGRYSTDSITVYTEDNGWAYFEVASHIAGANVVTITSGAVTEKLTIQFDHAAYDSGTSLVVDAPDWTLPGKNVGWTATLKDKFGNPVYALVNVKVTGLAGLNWNYTNWTDWTDGTHSDNTSLGVNDLGVLNVTYSYDQNDDGDYTDATDLVVKKSILVQNGAIVPADAKVAVSAPASSQNGRAVDVSVTVTTAAGVAIPGALVNLSGLGAGYLSATTATTDANGKVAVKLLAGADEIGDAVVTATAGSVSGTAKVSFGITDANLNIAGKRVTADWSFAAGKRVVIYRDGVQIRNFVVTSDASDSFSFNLTKGKHTVKIKVGGVTIDSQSYNIK